MQLRDGAGELCVVCKHCPGGWWAWPHMAGSPWDGHSCDNHNHNHYLPPPTPATSTAPRPCWSFGAEQVAVCTTSAQHSFGPEGDAFASHRTHVSQRPSPPSHRASFSPTTPAFQPHMKPPDEEPPSAIRGNFIPVSGPSTRPASPSRRRPDFGLHVHLNIADPQMEQLASSYVASTPLAPPTGL